MLRRRRIFLYGAIFDKASVCRPFEQGAIVIIPSNSARLPTKHSNLGTATPDDPPCSQEREVEAEADFACLIVDAHDPFIQLKLPSIALYLVVEKRVDTRAVVCAGLVVDDPTDAFRVDESPVNDDVHSARIEHRGQRELTAGVGVGVEGPAPGRVVEGGGDGVADARGDGGEFCWRHSQ